MHTFLGLWLRSSVVSVLISLIADMGDIVPLAINQISFGVVPMASLLVGTTVLLGD